MRNRPKFAPRTIVIEEFETFFGDKFGFRVQVMIDKLG